MNRQHILRACLLALAWTAGGCSSLYFSTMEKLGVDKREILVDRVEDARDGQVDAKEQFRTALERFKEVTHFEGGELEKAYDVLNGEYEDCASEVENVRTRIDKIEEVADALFDEWEGEIDEITNASYRSESKRMLGDTRNRYAELHRALVAAEEKMEPVLAAFHDQVLFIKHNLNAQAIRSLEGNVASIQGDVDRLIAEMENSIAKANAFIESMDNES